MIDREKLTDLRDAFGRLGSDIFLLPATWKEILDTIDKLLDVKEAAEVYMFGANRIVLAHHERLKDALAALVEKS